MNSKSYILLWFFLAGVIRCNVLHLNRTSTMPLRKIIKTTMRAGVQDVSYHTTDFNETSETSSTLIVTNESMTSLDVSTRGQETGGNIYTKVSRKDEASSWNSVIPTLSIQPTAKANQTSNEPISNIVTKEPLTTTSLQSEKSSRYERTTKYTMKISTALVEKFNNSENASTDDGSLSTPTISNASITSVNASVRNAETSTDPNLKFSRTDVTNSLSSLNGVTSTSPVEPSGSSSQKSNETLTSITTEGRTPTKSSENDKVTNSTESTMGLSTELVVNSTLTSRTAYSSENPPTSTDEHRTTKTVLNTDKTDATANLTQNTRMSTELEAKTTNSINVTINSSELPTKMMTNETTLSGTSLATGKSNETTSTKLKSTQPETKPTSSVSASTFNRSTYSQSTLEMESKPTSAKDVGKSSTLKPATLNESSIATTATVTHINENHTTNRTEKPKITKSTLSQPDVHTKITDNQNSTDVSPQGLSTTPSHGTRHTQKTVSEFQSLLTTELTTNSSASSTLKSEPSKARRSTMPRSAGGSPATKTFTVTNLKSTRDSIGSKENKKQKAGNKSKIGTFIALGICMCATVALIAVFVIWYRKLKLKYGSRQRLINIDDDDVDNLSTFSSSIYQNHHDEM